MRAHEFRESPGIHVLAFRACVSTAKQDELAIAVLLNLLVEFAERPKMHKCLLGINERAEVMVRES